MSEIRGQPSESQGRSYPFPSFHGCVKEENVFALIVQLVSVRSCVAEVVASSFYFLIASSYFAGAGGSPALPSAARSASRSGAFPTPGGSFMGTPHALAFGGGSQGAPNTGRRSSAGLTPRVDLGFYGNYIGFQHYPNSTGRRSSLAPSVS
jgi:hypothetical protein